MCCSVVRRRPFLHIFFTPAGPAFLLQTPLCHVDQERISPIQSMHLSNHVSFLVLLTTSDSKLIDRSIGRSVQGAFVSEEAC